MTGAVPNRSAIEEYGPDSGGRQKTVQISKPFLIGCRSRKLATAIPNPNPPPVGPPGAPSPNHSHEWTVYLRPYDNEDFSPWIKKVQFKLHDTYLNSLRTVSNPPYEVQETGWGEFDVAIKVFFTDPNERQVALYTSVRLFRKETEHYTIVNKDGYLIYEYYDEFLFNEPTLMMMDLLNQNRRLSTYVKPEIDYLKQKQDVMQRILTGRERVTPEIQVISTQYEAFKNAYADLMGILRGDSQSRNVASEAQSTVGSEYSGPASQDSSLE